MKLPTISQLRIKPISGKRTALRSPGTEGSKGLAVYVVLLFSALLAMAIVYSMVAIQNDYDPGGHAGG
jgi:hypothetical protein